MPSSPPGMGERVLRRLRDAGRRSLPPALSPDVLWSLFLARARSRVVLTISVATLVLVVLPVGLFFLGRSSVKPNKPVPEVTTAARGSVAALPVPPRAELAPPLAIRPSEPPLPPPPAEVAAAVYQAERLARIGAANEAMKGLRRAIEKRSHPLLWSTLGQLACGKDKSAIANQALEHLVEDKPEVRKARADLLLVCKSYDILENKSGKLIKLGGKKAGSLRLRPVR